MSELLRFFKDMRDNGYGLAEIAAQLGTSAIAEPVAGFAAMYDPAHGADAIREGMTYQPRTQAAQEYSQSVGNAASAAIKPAMPIIDTWKKGVDIAGQYSPVVGAGLRTVPTAIGIAMGAKPALQAGRQVSESLGAMQARMVANANAPRTLNAGYMGQRGAINPSDFNLVTNPDGTVTMYHGTTKDAAQRIIQERKLMSAGEPDVYMTTDPMAGYGDGTTVKFNIDPKHLNLDDEFPSGRVDFRMPAAKGWRIQNPEIHTPKKPLTEFEQAHLTAQRNAALPVNQGGLGLPADNTAMDRARAMGFDVDNPVYHGSLSNIESFDPKLSKDLKGVHVATIPEQANHFAKNNGGNVMPLVVKKTKEIELDDIFLNKDKDYYVPQRQSLGLEERNKKGELNNGYIDELNDYARKANESRYSDSYDGTEITKQEKKFFSELGKFLKSNDIDVVKYFNEVEGAADSYVITNPKNIRSRFAAFDPMQRQSSNLLAQSAKLAPTTALGAYMYNEKRKKSQGNQ